MNSIILCEGSTDYVLLQYYMRKACCWNDDSQIQNNVLKMSRQKSRKLIKNSDYLTIMAVGGSHKLISGLEKVLEKNILSSPDLFEVYHKIVIVTDNDDCHVEKNMINDIENLFKDYNVSYESYLSNNSWIECTMTNQIGITVHFSMLLLIIPFSENGAMETFLLEAIGKENMYDKKIIYDCNHFVEEVDPQRRYLNSRRIMTKAKFDTYFSIRTSAEQFSERRNILKNIPWERYSNVQTAFKKFSDI